MSPVEAESANAGKAAITILCLHGHNSNVYPTDFQIFLTIIFPGHLLVFTEDLTRIDRNQRRGARCKDGTVPPANLQTVYTSSETES